MVGTMVNGSRDRVRHPKTRSAVARASKPNIPRARTWIRLGELIDEDPDFSFARWIIGAMIQSTEIAIEGASEDSRAQAFVDELTDLWYETLPDIWDGSVAGFSAFEQVPRYDAQNGLRLVDLEYLPANIVSRKDDKDTGEFQGIDVRVGKDTVHLEPNESWWFGFNCTRLYPHGKSIYAGAPYKVWLESKEHDHNWQVYAKQFALGRAVGYAPEEYPEPRAFRDGEKGQENEDGTPASPIDDMARSYQDTESGGLAVFPSTVDDKGNKLFAFDPVQQQPNTQGMEARTTQLKDAKLLSMKIPPRAVSQDTAVGSYAMSETHLTVFYHTIYSYMDQIVASFQENVIDPLSRLNWSTESRPEFRLVPTKLDPSLVALITEIVKTSITSGQVSPLLLTGVVDLGKALDIAGVPTGDNIPQRLEQLKEMQAAAAQAPPPGAQFSLRQFAAPPASLAKTPEDHAERSLREQQSTFGEILRLLEDGVEFDDEGNVIGMPTETRRRL